MTLTTEITVGNNVTLGLDKVQASTNCAGFLTIRIPELSGISSFELELKRSELIEFLLRTQPNLSMELSVGINGGNKTL